MLVTNAKIRMKPTQPRKETMDSNVTIFHKGCFMIQKTTIPAKRTIFRIHRVDPKNLYDYVDAVREQMGLNLEDVEIKTEATRHYFYDQTHMKYITTHRFMAKVVFTMNRWQYMSLPWSMHLYVNDLHVRSGNKQNLFFEGCVIEMVGEGYTEACAVKSAIEQFQTEFEKTSKSLLEKIEVRQMSCECALMNERRDWSRGDIMCRSCILQYEERIRREQHQKVYEAYCAALTHASAM